MYGGPPIESPPDGGYSSTMPAWTQPEPRLPLSPAEREWRAWLLSLPERPYEGLRPLRDIDTRDRVKQRKIAAAKRKAKRAAGVPASDVLGDIMGRLF
jgi:hypothetical protein